MPTYITPDPSSNMYTCPHCDGVTQQERETIRILDRSIQSFVDLAFLVMRRCLLCKEVTIWWKGQRLFPYSLAFPTPNVDLPEEIRRDYLEAGAIADKSPRGAAALLRLCIQKLCNHLGCSGSSIDAATKELVASGMSATIVQALDVVRVVGNNAVHPGELDISDDAAIASTLARLVNLIAEDRITQPREIAALFASLPDGAKEAAKARNDKATNQ